MEGNTDTSRENLLETATNFLKNPKVAQTSLEQRKEFLRKKGLTEEEIQQAVIRSGAVDPAPVSNTQLAIPPPVVVQHTPVSTWERARDFASSAVLIGGIAYAAYQLYKKYISPWLYGPSEDQRRQEAILKTLTDLQRTLGESLTQLQQTVTSLKTTIEDEKSSDRRQVDRDLQYANEIKGEITSLKALLLNRKQFPMAPTPGVPSWQLQQTSQSDAGLAEMHTSSTDQPSSNTNQSVAPLGQTDGESDDTSQAMPLSGRPDGDTLAAKPDPQEPGASGDQLVMNGEHALDVNGESLLTNGEQAMAASSFSQTAPSSEEGDQECQGEDAGSNKQGAESDTVIAKLKGTVEHGHGGAGAESMATAVVNNNTDKTMSDMNGSADNHSEVPVHEHS